MGGGYLLLTFMLPKAEGCGTGLQLSAKDVVLGRPDMIRSRWFSLSPGETCGLLNGRTGRLAGPSHPKRMTANEEHDIYRKTGEKAIPLSPRFLASSAFHLINYP